MFIRGNEAHGLYRTATAPDCQSGNCVLVYLPSSSGKLLRVGIFAFIERVPTSLAIACFLLFGCFPQNDYRKQQLSQKECSAPSAPTSVTPCLSPRNIGGRDGVLSTLGESPTSLISKVALVLNFQSTTFCWKQA